MFDLTYDYDVWPFYEGVLTGKVSLREYADILTYQELTYPGSYVKARYLENHDTPRAASWMRDDTQLDQLGGVPLLPAGHCDALQRHGIRPQGTGGLL